MKLNKKILIAAVLLSLLTVGILYNYINSLKVETIAPVERTEVITAIDTIPRNTIITEKMLIAVSVPAEAVHPEAILNNTKIIGRVTNSEIIKGEQILESRLEAEGEGTSLSYDIPKDMRAITIPNNEISGVGAYIVPEDKIDILVTYTDPEVYPTKVTFTQLQNIKVIAVGTNNSGITEKDTVAATLTVLVKPEQAEIIAFAYVNGNFHYTLRNPADEKKKALDQYGAENLGSWRDR